MVDWLKKPYQSESNDSKKPRAPFFTDIGKKLLAVVIAISLWLVANLQHDIEKNINIDINYSNLPPGLIIANNPPEKLTVRVRGPRSQLSSVNSDNMLFTVDLSNLGQGMSRFDVTTDQIIPPRDVQVTGISPAEIEVDIDKLADKNVKVVPSLGPLATGYEIIGEPEVSPSQVKIRGPEGLIAKINSITTDPIRLEKEKSKFTIEVPLRPPYALVKVIGNNTVRVTVDIEERTLEKEFNNLNINFVNFEDVDYETDRSIVTELSFEGPFSIINNLNSEDIELSVDGSEITDSGDGKTHKLEVTVNYPHKEMLKLKKQSPKTIEIKLN
jgi:YbbR domain-containing protein